MNKKILISGNEAMAEAAIQAGCTFYAGYPITPQNELIAYMAEHMPKRGRTFIQAESELGAINMVFGASAAGARAMTSSSSPGISLKQEGISYLSGAQLPAVIVNVMRGGPGLGNILPSQSDYFQAVKGGGHGDYHPIVVAPYSVEEAYELTGLAFDLADKYRSPVIILADGLLGQMMEPVLLSSKLVSGLAGSTRKPVNPQTRKPWALTGCAGRKPNVVKSFYLNGGELEKLNLILQKKYKAVQDKEARWEEYYTKDAKIILVAYGTMARIAKTAINALRKKGKRVGLIRPITLWPFPVKAFKVTRSPGHQVTSYLVVEMSYGQMLEDVKLAVNGRSPVKFLGRAGGGIPAEEEIIKNAKSIYSS